MTIEISHMLLISVHRSHVNNTLHQVHIPVQNFLCPLFDKQKSINATSVETDVNSLRLSGVKCTNGDRVVSVTIDRLQVYFLVIMLNRGNQVYFLLFNLEQHLQTR
jgi:hypothetical protein